MVRTETNEGPRFSESAKTVDEVGEKRRGMIREASVLIDLLGTFCMTALECRHRAIFHNLKQEQRSSSFSLSVVPATDLDQTSKNDHHKVLVSFICTGVYG